MKVRGYIKNIIWVLKLRIKRGDPRWWARDSQHSMSFRDLRLKLWEYVCLWEQYFCSSTEVKIAVPVHSPGHSGQVHCPITCSHRTTGCLSRAIGMNTHIELLLSYTGRNTEYCSHMGQSAVFHFQRLQKSLPSGNPIYQCGSLPVTAILVICSNGDSPYKMYIACTREHHTGSEISQ